MVGKVGVNAGDGFATGQFFRFQGLAVGGEDELGAGFGGGRAGAQGFEGVAHNTDLAGGDMDVAALEHAAGHIRCIVVAGAQTFEGRVFIAESRQEGERKLRRVEGLERQIGNSLFDFYCIHDSSCLGKRPLRSHPATLPRLTRPGERWSGMISASERFWGENVYRRCVKLSQWAQWPR